MLIVFMIPQDGVSSASNSILPVTGRWLRNTPDSEEKRSRAGSDTEIQATASLKDESTGSSASRFGSAKAAMSARRFIVGRLWWTFSVALNSKTD